MFRVPMVCSLMRISAPVMTGAKSTLVAPNNRGSVFTRTLPPRLRPAILTKTIPASPILPIDDVLSELLRRSARVRARGADVRYQLPIEFLEAVTGVTKRLTLPDGGTLDVNGQVLRLRGKGRPGIGDGEPGDVAS